MESNTKRVRIKDIAALMTCPICNKLQKNAVTIHECLHTFCRKCIYKKIIEEELRSCPVCKTDLGCSPLERLRPDHNMRSLKQGIFASLKKTPKREPGILEEKEAKKPEAAKELAEIVREKEAKEPEMPSIPVPCKRKERSLSSLVNPIPTRTASTGRRKSANPRRFTPNLPVNEEPTKEVEEHPGSSSSPMTLRKTIQNKKQQNFTDAESSKRQMPNKEKENISEPLEGITDLWKPLNCLVEAADMTRSDRSNSEGIVLKSVPPSTIHEDIDEAITSKTKGKKCADKSKVLVHDDDVYSNYKEEKGANSSLTPVKGKVVRRGKQKRIAASEGNKISPQAVINAASSNSKRMTNSIWLSLVASPYQEGDLPLPQIPSCYLMIKDVHVPVSFIKKYLMRKLDLDSEDEVEIEMRGQPLPPTLQLYNLVDLWSRTAVSSEITTVSIGSSAKDFVMVISYGRKA